MVPFTAAVVLPVMMYCTSTASLLQEVLLVI